MRMCMEHWKRLRQAIDERGLSHLIAKDGKAAVDSIERQLKREDDKSDFDPLMGANWAIFSAFVRDAGLAAMAGEKCPLCEVAKNPLSRKDLDQNWIDGACDDQLAHARHLGLMPEAS